MPLARENSLGEQALSRFQIEKTSYVRRHIVG